MDVYFRRDIEVKMEEWYHKKFKNILHVDGARQVGKTCTIEHFIRNHYQNVISINLAKDDYKWFVDALRNSTNNWSKIDVIRFTEMIPNEFRYVDDDSTVIFLDEIQSDHVVYNYLRSLNRDLKCDVIVSGSYLMMALKQEFFQPAGDFESITMYPMSFGEFLNAVSDSLYSEYVRWPENKITENSLSGMKSLFGLYCEIGGYPEVIKEFVFSKSLKEAHSAMESIIRTVILDSQFKLDDIVDAKMLGSVSRSIIRILIREKRGSKNIYEALVKNFQDKPSNRLNKVATAKILAWLTECHFLEPVDKYVLPDTTNDYPGEKLYFGDIGALRYYAKDRDFDSSNIDGIIAENFVFNAMLKSDYINKFFDYSPHFGVYRDGEIDFFARAKYDRKNYAFEVKSGNESGNTATKLLKDGVADKLIYFMGNHQHKIDGNVEIVPLFLAERWFDEFPCETYDIDLSILDSSKMNLF